MRLQVFSDLHLESGPFKPVLDNPDVVVLAGDIHEGTEGVKWAKRCFRDLPVIYVLGNHEFYNHRLSDLVKKLKREARGSQVHVLENDVFEWKGYSFLGCTLWTDFNLGPANASDAMFIAWGEMADYSLIQKDGAGASLHPKDTALRIFSRPPSPYRLLLAGPTPSRDFGARAKTAPVAPLCPFPTVTVLAFAGVQGRWRARLAVPPSVKRAANGRVTDSGFKKKL